MLDSLVVNMMRILQQVDTNYFKLTKHRSQNIHVPGQQIDPGMDQLPLSFSHEGPQVLVKGNFYGENSVLT